MYELLAIAAVALIALIALKIVKKAVSIVFTVATVIGVFLLIGGFFVLQDANDFKNDFVSSKNVFVLSDNSTYITSIVLDLNKSGEGVGLQEYDDMKGLKEDVADGNVPDDYYKVFILEKGWLSESGLETVSVGGQEYTAQEASEALYGEDTDEELRRVLFASSLISVLGEGPLPIIEGVKEGNILIHPDSLMFQTLDFIPLTVFEQAEGFMGNNSEE